MTRAHSADLGCSVRRILLYPQSGYINRLQSIASSSILADQLNAQLSVCWEPDAVAPASASSVFSDEFCSATVISTEAAAAEFGVHRVDVPRYLGTNAAAGRITLAGHDLGEQHFMQELRTVLSSHPDLDTLVIAAGGKFLLTDEGEPETSWPPRFRELRRDFYSRLRLSAGIEQTTASALEGRQPYIGLHLRYTDRAHQSPSDRAISAALERVVAVSRVADVFVAADSAGARDRWVERVRDLGLTPWWIDHSSWDRSVSGTEHAALADWRTLGHAARLVYFAESSFAEEAAVASGHWDESIALPAQTLRGAWVRARSYATAARTYPKRHGWI